MPGAGALLSIEVPIPSAVEILAVAEPWPCARALSGDLLPALQSDREGISEVAQCGYVTCLGRLLVKHSQEDWLQPPGTRPASQWASPPCARQGVKPHHSPLWWWGGSTACVGRQTSAGKANVILQNEVTAGGNEHILCWCKSLWPDWF